jgi:hypothetical protein
MRITALQLTPHRSVQSIRRAVWRRAPAPLRCPSARCGAPERPVRYAALGFPGFQRIAGRLRVRAHSPR